MKYQTPQQLANVGMLALLYVYKRIQGLYHPTLKWISFVLDLNFE